MKPLYKKLTLIIGDLFCLLAALFSELLIRYRANFTPEILNLHILPFGLLFFLTIVILYIFDLYELHKARPGLNFYAALSIILLSVTLFGAVVFYFLPINGLFPKINLVLTFLLGGIIIVLWRGAFFAAFQDSMREKIVILNYNDRLSDFVMHTAGSAEYDILLFVETPQAQGNQINIENFSGKYIPANKISKQKDLKADIIIIGTKTEDLNEWLPKISATLGWPRIWDIETAYDTVMQKIPLAGLDVLWFAKYANDDKKFFERLKRIIDIVFSIIFFILGIPFFLLIGIAIFLEDKGPILYRQERVGKNKKVFKLVKFRSMSVNAESDGKALWARKDDQRITKVGRVIRTLHLDELPQLFNILCGDIALIGPRPERPEFVKQLEKEIEFYENRHVIKPGFTGWAQIKFRYARSIDDSRQKYEYDLFYLKNRSLMLDFKILLKTAQLFFKRD